MPACERERGGQEDWRRRGLDDDGQRASRGAGLAEELDRCGWACRLQQLGGERRRLGWERWMQHGIGKLEAWARRQRSRQWSSDGDEVVDVRVLAGAPGQG